MNQDVCPITPVQPPELFAPLFLSGTPTDEKVVAFLAEQRFPVAEPGGVTFAWTGDADRVELIRWIHAGIDREPFQRIPGTKIWVLLLDVPDGGRFEYKLAIHRRGHEEWMLDPLNRERAGDPFGENSVCRTWGYERPAWTRPQGAPKGEIVALRVASTVFAETREEFLYRPARPAGPSGYPVVVIHDGHDFNTYADLTVSLDNLIEAGDIPPVTAVLIQTHKRIEEYTRGRRHARYVVDELMPAISEETTVSPIPSDRILLGASLGAVASLSTAFRYPGVFGGLVLKSGSFIFDDHKLTARPHPVFHRVARLVRAIHRAPDLARTRAFVSTGELEGLASENIALANFLRQRGVDVLLKTAWDGHHWHNWRDQLRDGLMWVLREQEAA